MYLKHCTLVSRLHRKGLIGTNLETLLEFLLLFVNYSKSEIDFVCLFEVWLHSHNL